jgi:hypothetical protein
MTEPVIEQTEEAAPAAEFSDALSDESLDRWESLACYRPSSSHCFVDGGH